MAEQPEIRIRVAADELDAFGTRLQSLMSRLTELQGSIRQTQQQAGTLASQQLQHVQAQLQAQRTSRMALGTPQGQVSTLFPPRGTTVAGMTSAIPGPNAGNPAVLSALAAAYGPGGGYATATAAQLQAQTASLLGNAGMFGTTPPGVANAGVLAQLAQAYAPGARYTSATPAQLRSQVASLLGNTGAFGTTPASVANAPVLAQLAQAYAPGAGHTVVSAAQMQAQVASLIGNRLAVGGPAPPIATGPGYETTLYAAVGGGAFGRAFGGLGRRALGGLGMGLAGTALGVSAFQFLQEGRQVYEDRFRGILQIGYQLDTQWGKLVGTLDTLRHGFQLTTRDALTAMRTMAATTGQDPSVLLGAVGVGRAYGFEAEVPRLFAQLSMLGANPTPNLAQLTGQYNQFVRGRANISMQRFLSEVGQIAEVGGLRAAPLDESDYGMIAQRFVGMGGRFAAHPAAAYAEQYGRLESPTSPFGMGGRYMAIADLAQRQRYLRLGPGELIDIRNPLGVVAAMQQAAQLPEVQRAYFERARAMGGGDETRGINAYMELSGISNVRQATLEYRSFAAGQQPRPANLGQETANIDRIRKAADENEEAQKGELLRRKDINNEILSETKLLDSLEKVQGNLVETTGKVIQKFDETGNAVQALGEGIKTINEQSVRLLGNLAYWIGVFTMNPGLIGVGIGLGTVADIKSGQPGLVDQAVRQPGPSPTPGLPVGQLGGGVYFPYAAPMDPSRYPRTPG